MRYRRASDWTIITYCDYGRMEHKSRLARHYTAETAKKAWKDFIKWYGPTAYNIANRSYRIWQETRWGGEVINDTGSYGHKIYGT